MCSSHWYLWATDQFFKGMLASKDADRQLVGYSKAPRCLTPSDLIDLRVRDKKLNAENSRSDMVPLRRTHINVIAWKRG